jgi:ABC-2 type transport system permease protein/capsular polysaccharide transport system permease protein
MVNNEGLPVVGRLVRDSPWAINRRVIGALLIREMLTRYGRNNIGFLWLFVEPILFTLMLTAFWTATRSIHGSNIPIVAFAVTGYLSLLLWRNMPNRCINALQANMSLLYHRQVTITDIYYARIILEAMAATTSLVVLVIGFWAMEWLTMPEDIFQVLGGWLLLAWFGAGLALTVGGLSEKWDVVGKLWPPFSFILFPMSGVAFLADALPPKVRSVVLWLPMLNALEFLREGWFGTLMHAHYNIPYVVLFNFILTFTGFSLARQAGLDSSKA